MEEFVFTKNDNNYTYEDDKGVYTFTDMGDYMTAGRDPLDNAPVMWYLSRFDGKLNNIEVSMEASFERFSRGYSRILINDNIPVFYINGVRDPSIPAPGKAIELADWFIEANSILTPKLNEYIKNHQDERQIAS